MNANKKYIGEIFIVLVILIMFIILCKKNLERFYSFGYYNDDDLTIDDYVGKNCPYNELGGDLKPIFLMYRDTNTSKDYMVEYNNNPNYFILIDSDYIRNKFNTEGLGFYLNAILSEYTDVFEYLKDTLENKILFYNKYLKLFHEKYIEPHKHRFYLKDLGKNWGKRTFQLLTPKKEPHNVYLNQVCKDSFKKVGNCGKTTALYLIKKPDNHILSTYNISGIKKTIFMDAKWFSQDKKTFYFKCYYCKPNADVSFPDFTYLEGGRCKDSTEPKYPK